MDEEQTQDADPTWKPSFAWRALRLMVCFCLVGSSWSMSMFWEASPLSIFCGFDVSMRGIAIIVASLVGTIVFVPFIIVTQPKGTIGWQGICLCLALPFVPPFVFDATTHFLEAALGFHLEDLIM